jgi:hypothetical protein
VTIQCLRGLVISGRRPVVLANVAVVAALAISLGTLSVVSGASIATHARPSSASSFLSTLGHVAKVGSTVPTSGDVNPYGVAVVHTSVGRLVRGDVLVSNFNDAANVQGTGRTLVEISPQGKLTLFERIGTLPKSAGCRGGVGLGTGLAILPGGWVVVGSIPAVGPSGAPAPANPNGCLLVLNDNGTVVESWSNNDINGPWDLTTFVQGSRVSIFVSNALARSNGKQTLPKTGLCTISRLDVTLGKGLPHLTSSVIVGTEFPWEVNAPTFVLAPTGLAISSSGTLYVAQTLGSYITTIPNALTRTTAIQDGKSTLTSHGYLNEPLGLLMAPNGDLLATNGNNGMIVEITPSGHQIAKATLVANGAGTLFGLDLSLNAHGIDFVNDGSNSLDSDSPRTS